MQNNLYPTYTLSARTVVYPAYISQIFIFLANDNDIDIG